MTDNLLSSNNKSFKSSGITPMEIFFKYLKYLPWLIVSIVACLLIAYLNIRYTTPVYNINGKLLIKSTSQNNANQELNTILLMSEKNNLADETEIIRSTQLASRVITALDLQTRIYNKGNVRASLLHKNDYPFLFEIINIKDSSQPFKVTISLLNDREFRVNGVPEKFLFNQIAHLPFCDLKIVSLPERAEKYENPEFTINWTPLQSLSTSYSNSISVIQAEDFANVLTLSVESENKKVGQDVVNQYMKEYLLLSMEDKKEVAFNTLAFIDEQLDTVRRELGSVESTLQKYRESSQVYNPEIQSQVFFNNLSETERNINQHKVKVKVIDFLIRKVSDPADPFEIVPSTLGIEEPSLNEQISQYNKLQLERNAALETTPAENPLVKNIETNINKLRIDILQNLQNVRQTYQLSLTAFEQKNKEAGSQIASIPGKEKQLYDVTRQQAVLKELYSFLLQKKLETSIGSASTISNRKVLEPALASGKPIKPKPLIIYLIALMIGIILPVTVVFLREILDDKVKSKSDVQQVTDVPILGEIGHSSTGETIVATKNNRSLVAEQFRIIRSNLQYILPDKTKPIVLVTSSFGGEGKSFVCTNFASVLALSGKRVALLEFDIRKPKILKGMNMSDQKGLTNYIIGSVSAEEIIYPVPQIENLFVVPCGPLPPNPSEILLDHKMEPLFELLKERFDAIVIDSAPVGLVSDAITLSAYANASIYIVRHNYTLKKQLNFLNDLYVNKKLAHMSVVINDINSKGGYGYGYGYGGYGYGYGYGYGDYMKDKKKGKSIFRKK